MLIKLTSDKCVSESAALHAAVQANHFGVMQVHNLKETMAKKGVEFERECLIFDVCQPQQAKKVLDQNMSVSTALPCRISIYDEGGKAILGTEAHHPSSDVQCATTSKGGAGSRGHDCKDHERGSVGLIRLAQDVHNRAVPCHPRTAVLISSVTPLQEMDPI